MNSTPPLTDKQNSLVETEDVNKYGYLVVNDRWYEIKTGETSIGRDASVCSIVLGEVTVSNLHAVIEFEGPEDAFIYDAGSTNKTKIGKMVLKPHCRYKINNNDRIVLGITTVQYKVVDSKVDSSPSCILKSEKCNPSLFDVDGQSNSETDKPRIQKTSEEILYWPKKPYYTSVSEISSLDIFSQATQCEILDIQEQSANIKNSSNDIYDRSTECDNIKRSDSNLNLKEKVKDTLFDDSDTFNFVDINKTRCFTSAVTFESIDEDIFDLATQCQSNLPEAEDVNFRNYITSKPVEYVKIEEEEVKLGDKTDLGPEIEETGTELKEDVGKCEDLISSEMRRRKSETASSDITDSDIVESPKPVLKIENYEITEVFSEEDLYDIEECSNDSECLITKEIKDGSSLSKDIVVSEYVEAVSKTHAVHESTSLLANSDGVKISIENIEKDLGETLNLSDLGQTDCEIEPRACSKIMKKMPDTYKLEGFGRNTQEKRKGKMGKERNNSSGKPQEKALFFHYEGESKKEDSVKRRTDLREPIPKKKPKDLEKKKENSRERNRIKNSTAYSYISSNKLLSLKPSKTSPMKVAFTGFESESSSRIIAKLGGLRVDNLAEADVLVTNKIRRTVKFLSAIALGVPVVSPHWLLFSEKESKFLNPWEFILEDEYSERKWNFNLKTTLENWKREKLLKGFSVFATESTKPPVPKLLNIIKYCGGAPLACLPVTWPDKSIVLTCKEDQKFWPVSRSRKVKVVHYEFLLSGILQYFMDFETYRLR